MQAGGHRFDSVHLHHPPSPRLRRDRRAPRQSFGGGELEIAETLGIRGKHGLAGKVYRRRFRETGDGLFVIVKKIDPGSRFLWIAHWNCDVILQDVVLRACPYARHFL